MKSNIKILVFVVVLLYGMKARAQTDDTENMIKQNLKEALMQGDSNRSQRAYNAWKEYANNKDSIVEKFIKSCNENNTRAFKGCVLIYWAINSNPKLTASNGKYKGEKKMEIIMA